MAGARIAIVGGGPIGVEAALEAALRGHDVALYEAERIGAHLLRFAWVRLFTPFGMNSSRRARARLAHAGTPLPADDAIHTAGDLVARYLEPLARLPELEGRIREGARVVQIGREGLSKGEGIAATGDRSRFGRPFLLSVSGGGAPRFERADIVFDATGVYGTPRAAGPGGLAALGEEALGSLVERHPPDLLGEARPRFAGRRVLLVGSGHSAATALVGFQALSEAGEPATVAWVRRVGPSRAGASDPSGAPEPFALLRDDPLPERRALARAANAIAGATGAGWLTRHDGATVEAFEARGREIRVSIRPPGGPIATVAVDRVLALVGYRPDTAISRELQVHHCYASEGPMGLATALLAASSADSGAAGDCLAQTTHGGDSLRTPEPGFFVLGAKSYGRNPAFLLSVGRRQVEEVLDLIETERPTAVAPAASAP